MPQPHRYGVGYTGGVFDMFHIGHLNILKHSKEHCDYLIAGVVDDDEVLRIKGRRPVVPLAERMEILRHIDLVDEVVLQHGSDRVATHRAHPFDVLFKGDDWKDTPKGDALSAELRQIGAELVYLPYTPSTSSTHLRHLIEELIP